MIDDNGTISLGFQYTKYDYDELKIGINDLKDIDGDIFADDIVSYIYSCNCGTAGEDSLGQKWANLTGGKTYAYRGRKTKIIIGVIFVLVAIIIILMSWIHPVKYAIQEEDFSNYSEYILVREVHYTGTGWSMVGGTGGYFPSEEVVDIILEGEKLPEAYTPTESYNTFLCIAEYQGKKKYVALEEEFDCYLIKDWYPVYPVVRNGRLLPQFCYPRRYMTEKDIKEY